MHINYIHEKIPITKEEYENNLYKCKDNSLSEKVYELLHNMEYIKDPIYKEPGLKSIMNNEIIGYNYYKLGETRGCLICSKSEYNKINELRKR